jgi:uncharacterized membrane protein
MSYLSVCLFFASILGMYFTYLHGRKTKKFKWSEYFLLISVPVVSSLSFSLIYGVRILYFFVISSIIGFLLEYILGFFYHKTLNRRLWTYGKYNVGGYTSILTFPLWGVAGMLFWVLSKQIGL